jgi:hypothetical protein
MGEDMKFLVRGSLAEANSLGIGSISIIKRATFFHLTHF